ncbi:MAG: hypothetical protein WAU58_08430 [Terriglobales bacterium]
MSDSKSKQPKVRESPQSGKIKTGGDPSSVDTQTIAWHFHRLDHQHEHWGWSKLSAKQWREMLTQLVAFEGLTWAALQAQSGGRKHGTNHHPIEINKFCAAAKSRLITLHLDDFDTLFSLRINNTLRLYGVRDGRVLQLVWHDPHHGSKHGAYPLKQ